ncbi:MAG: tRNA (N6-isopentenyl adenosine(37)-C2)-methylthiotransferase MiaB [bacterium]
MPAVQPPIETSPLPGLSRAAVKAPRVYIETYGCQMNVNDSELIGGILREAGCRLVGHPDEADLILLNTCAVRENAEQRIVGRTGQLAGLKDGRELRIGIVGCMAQHLREDLLDQVPHADFILGPDAYRSLPEILDLADGERMSLCQLDREELYEGLPLHREEGAVEAFVTIMRGCDRMCTFCVVPMTRGRERSRRWQDVVAEVKGLVGKGVREVTLLGQTVNAYRDEGLSFGNLLWKVAETGIPRIRFTSPHPVYYQDDEIDAIAECDAVCEWVHLPVQSGSTEVLERMHRGYTRERYLEIVERIRSRVPDVTVTTDIIVGFPGETEAQFQETLSLMEACDFDGGYLFKYSPREGTRAARDLADDLPPSVKQQRLEEVLALQSELTGRSNRAMLGREFEVLFTEEGNRGPDQWVGRTRGNKTVVVESEKYLKGRMLPVVVEETGSWTLRGRLV